MTLEYGRRSSKIFHENEYVRGILLCLFHHYKSAELHKNHIWRKTMMWSDNMKVQNESGTAQCVQW